MPLSLGEQVGATEAVNQCTRLWSLDRLWTDYLQRAEWYTIERDYRGYMVSEGISEEDEETLGEVAEQMVYLLEEAQESARFLGNAITEHLEELNEGYQRILTEDELTEDQNMLLQDVADTRHGGISAYGSSSAQEVLDKVPIERQTLEAQMSTLGSGGLAEGDLSKDFGCNLAGLCIVSGIFAPPPMNLIGISIGLTILVSYEVGGEPC